MKDKKSGQDHPRGEARPESSGLRGDSARRADAEVMEGAGENARAGTRVFESETPDAEAPEPEEVGAEEVRAEETLGASGTLGDEAAAVGAEDRSDAAKAQEYFEQMLRLKAEFDNYRRRVSKERQDWARSARASVVSQLLTVLDDAKRARRHAEEMQQIDAEGVMLILRRFEEAITQLGVKELETPPGVEFDPEMHEALMTAPSGEIPEGHIVATMEPGYTYEDQLLRPGKVSVSSGEG